MPSKEEILKAEAVHFILLDIEDKIKNDADKVIFITADLFTNFVKNIYYSKHIKAQLISNITELAKFNYKAGMRGFINTIEFHIIAGKNKLYVGLVSPISNVVEALEKISEEK